MWEKYRAVGNFAHMPPELETLVCQELGLILQTRQHKYYNEIAMLNL